MTNSWKLKACEFGKSITGRYVRQPSSPNITALLKGQKEWQFLSKKHLGVE